MAPQPTIGTARETSPASATRKRRVRVAQCIHGLQLGGAQQVVKYITKCGDKSRYEYFVYASLDGAVGREIEPSDAVVRIIPRHVPKLDLVWLWRLARAFRRDGIDVVHTHLFGDSLHGALAARIAGSLPVVMTLHSVAENASPIQARAYRRLIRVVERAVACSPSSLASYLRAAGRAARIDMIPNGLAPEAVGRAAPAEIARMRSELGVGEGETLIGAVGRFVEAKGYSHLIRAMRELRSQAPVKLALVGTGPLAEALREQARFDGVEDVVVFTGFRADTRELVSAFDVVAFSSLHEGIPLALLEAMAASRCIVATAVPSIVDVVEDGHTALLVPPRDPAALAHALLRTVRDHDLRARLGAAGQRRFRNEFTADRMTARYETIYAELAATRVAQRPR